VPLHYLFANASPDSGALIFTFCVKPLEHHEIRSNNQALSRSVVADRKNPDSFLVSGRDMYPDGASRQNSIAFAYKILKNQTKSVFRRPSGQVSINVMLAPLSRMRYCKSSRVRWRTVFKLVFRKIVRMSTDARKGKKIIDQHAHLFSASTISRCNGPASGPI